MAFDERSFGRGEGKQRVPAGLRGMPVQVLWVTNAPGTGRCKIKLLFPVGSHCRTVHRGSVCCKAKLEFQMWALLAQNLPQGGQCSVNSHQSSLLMGFPAQLSLQLSLALSRLMSVQLEVPLSPWLLSSFVAQGDAPGEG